MATNPSTPRVDIDDLEERDAEQLLRRVLYTSGLSSQEQLPVLTDDLRDSLATAADELEYQLVDPAVDENHETPELAKQALRVLADDPVYRPFLSAGSTPPASASGARDFAVDPITLVGVSTLCLVVINTYVHIERSASGKWTFEFKIKPASKALQAELLKLINSIVGATPKS
jgi:hypothetical protein